MKTAWINFLTVLVRQKPKYYDLLSTDNFYDAEELIIMNRKILAFLTAAMCFAGAVPFNAVAENSVKGLEGLPHRLCKKDRKA